MSEIVKSVTITVTTEATAVKSAFLDKKHVLIEALRSNQGKIYVALSYDLFTGRKGTDFEPIKPSEPRFYGAPQQKSIGYIWYYAETSGDGFTYTASDGAIERPIYPQDYRLLKFVRKKFDKVLVNNTDALQDFVVPAGKRWFITGGLIHNADDVARNIYVALCASDGFQIGFLRKYASIAATNLIRFPLSSDSDVSWFTPEVFPIIANAGEYVRFGWIAGGASTGGTAVNLLEYYEVDLT